MPVATGRLHQQLLGRMLLFVVLPTALVLILVVTLAAWAGFESRRRASEETLRLETTLVAEEIESLNRDAAVSAQRMAEAQTAGMFGDRSASIEYARLVLESSPNFTGAYFGYEPDADGQDQKSLGVLPKQAMDETGRFIPYWFIAPAKGNRIELEPLVDMESSLYYAGAREAFERTKQPAVFVTEPYVYQGKMIVEQVYPIVIDGAFAGIAGIDRALASVEEYLRRHSVAEGADAFLISSRGKFIAATTDPAGDMAENSNQLKTRVVADTRYGGIMGDLVAGKQSLVLDEDPIDGERYYFASARTPTGGWTIVLRRSESEILAPIYAQLRFGVGALLLGLALVCGLIILNTVQVSRRVRLALEAADRVARGDLTQKIEVGRSHDETGVLLRAVQTMTDNLNSLVSGVKQASIQINSTATELTATSREQESVVNTFGSSANQIAAAVKEISCTGSELVRTMDDVSRVANDTAHLASDGQEALRHMEGSMLQLDEATNSIADKLAVINEKASNITSVVTTITKVADQTNLLSVNAAIEAEKAGEYGVGFLVVAREIRRLADQTAAATLNIEQMVRDMESAVSAGVMEMDRFSDQVRQSVKETAKVAQQLEGIIEQVNTNSASFERVNEGMQSQSQGAEQISEAMGQLTTGAKQTAEATREFAHAAEDLQSSIASLKSSIASFQLRS